MTVHDSSRVAPRVRYSSRLDALTRCYNTYVYNDKKLRQPERWRHEGDDAVGRTRGRSDDAVGRTTRSVGHAGTRRGRGVIDRS